MTVAALKRSVFGTAGFYCIGGFGIMAALAGDVHVLAGQGEMGAGMVEILVTTDAFCTDGFEFYRLHLLTCSGDFYPWMAFAAKNLVM